MRSSPNSNSDPALQMQGISKRFPGTLAVDGVDFVVERGQTHALMGENGAGKSTLMNILAGSFADYEGQIFIGGAHVSLHSPAQAKAAGIGMIHQELSLALPLSIAENILAGRLPSRGGVVNKRAMRDEANEALARVGLDIDASTLVEALSQHEAQLVEIARALAAKPSILVLDEPTSALSRPEVEKLFEIIRGLKKQGLALVYISHHLPEIFEVADAVTVLRDGRKIESRPISEWSSETLVEAMVGRSVEAMRVARAQQPGEVRLEVAGLTRRGFFRDVSLQIRRGEILGLAGLAGSGRSEIARSLCAIDPLDGGQIRLDGVRVAPRNLREAMRLGLAYLSEDRKAQGLALGLSLLSNVLAPFNARSKRPAAPREAAGVFARLAAELQISPPEPARRARELSGGNQQKVLLAKWMAIEPDVLVLDEPTRGVDIGAKQVIHEAIGRLADAGKSILLITSDLPEMVALANRVAVLRRGRIVGELKGEEISQDQILLAVNGGVLADETLNAETEKGAR